jgi:hypothetical protein
MAHTIACLHRCASFIFKIERFFNLTPAYSGFQWSYARDDFGEAANSSSRFGNPRAEAGRQ